MRVQDEADPHVIDGLALMRALFKIAVAADRRKVVELAKISPSLAGPRRPQ